jgi:hypothetical protein
MISGPQIGENDEVNKTDFRQRAQSRFLLRA